MVYESDFYTTRRPYSYRPNVSSYSVTSRVISVPTVRKVHSFTSYPIYSTYPVVRHRTIPYVAHKRLVTGTRSSVSRSSITPARTITRIVSIPTFRTVTPLRYTTPVRYSTPARFPITPIAVLTSPANYVRSYTTRISTSPTRTTYSIRTRPSIFEKEYKRIENKIRSRPGHLYTDSYLNSDSVRAFDDATKTIRNDANTLIRKIHQRVDRAQSCLPASSYTAKYEKRYGPDSFVAHLVAPLKSTTYNGLESWNPNKYIAKLDPLRPSRKFSQAKDNDDECDKELREKQALRAQRLQALAEETFDEDAFAKRKSEFASKLQDEPVKAKKSEKQKQIEEEEAERLKEQQRQEAEQARKEAERKKAAEEEARRQEELEQQRIAAEEKARQAELDRKAELKRQKAEEEAKKLELARIAAEEAERERQAELARQAELEKQAEIERQAELERKAQEEKEEQERIAAEEERERQAELARQAEESAPEEPSHDEHSEAEPSAADDSVSHDEPLSESEVDEEQLRAERLAEDERRQQEQKQREIEMARLAELEEIAQQEQEAEIARQAAELAELARQQEAEARKQQEEEAASESGYSVAEELSEGPQSSKYADNDDIENEDDVVINHDTVDVTDDDAQSVASNEAESSKYESEEETE